LARLDGRDFGAADHSSDLARASGRTFG
jgi:hypothetical protein